MPHRLALLSDRQQLYHRLAEFVNKQSAHGPKLICGGYNARFFRQLPGEEDVVVVVVVVVVFSNSRNPSPNAPFIITISTNLTHYLSLVDWTHSQPCHHQQRN